MLESGSWGHSASQTPGLVLCTVCVFKADSQDVHVKDWIIGLQLHDQRCCDFNEL